MNTVVVSGLFVHTERDQWRESTLKLACDAGAELCSNMGVCIFSGLCGSCLFPSPDRAHMGDRGLPTQPLPTHAIYGYQRLKIAQHSQFSLL